ncbi:hypothetical protein [Kitasatospora sp. NPDC087315]|uniref:hypothetical protein n=1 Tax=Kitasatospora sp. NPDC087315 TaxID=3364069 RepID=UPI003805310F
MTITQGQTDPSDAGSDDTSAWRGKESTAESCLACQREEARAGRCGGCAAAIGADAAAVALEGMPKNAAGLVHEADQLGWDVRTERRQHGRRRTHHVHDQAG